MKNIKINWQVGLAVLLGITTTDFIFYLAGWNYNSFHDAFDFRKVIVEYGVPMAGVLIWMWIIRMVFKSKK